MGRRTFHVSLEKVVEVLGSSGVECEIRKGSVNGDATTLVSVSAAVECRWVEYPRKKM